MIVGSFYVDTRGNSCLHSANGDPYKRQVQAVSFCLLPLNSSSGAAERLKALMLIVEQEKSMILEFTQLRFLVQCFNLADISDTSTLV